MGLANSLVAAIGISAIEPRLDPDAMVMTGMFLVMMVPGIISGAILGWLAGKCDALSVRARLVMLLVPAWGIVAFLGVGTGLVELILVSCIPTTAGVLILERRTRRIVAPAVPPAWRSRSRIAAARRRRRAAGDLDDE